jgi:hypothetical protein
LGEAVQKAAYSSVRIEYLKLTSEGYPNKLALKILFEQPLTFFPHGLVIPTGASEANEVEGSAD